MDSPQARLQRFIDLRPVDDIPPGADVVGSAILIFQVVGVLPDVEAEDGVLALHQWIVLVRSARNRQFAAVVEQPHPAAAEASGTSLRPLLLELVEAAERGVDSVSN